MPSYVRGTGGREQTFSEVGDLRDVRVPGRVSRGCHARPPPPFTAAESLGPAPCGPPSCGPAAGGTDAPCVRFLPPPDFLRSSPLPLSVRRWVSSGRSLALPRAQR